MTVATGRKGVLLMTYGSPRTLERADVGEYLARIRGGKAADDELLDEFTRRYQVIGGSPLIQITRAQASALEAALGWPAVAGMRFSSPTIADGIRELAGQGVDEIAAIILSPQFSPLLMGGYARAIEAARAEVGPEAPRVEIAGAWHDQPAFTAALAERLAQALAELPAGERDHVAILMTAHSLPRRVAEQEPAYLAQLRDTADAIARAAGLGPDRWQFCWQSAGHEPGEWMKPDFADLMPAIAASGGRSVIVVPVQFLADHLEILYDVDVGAREQAEHAGVAFHRIASLNVDPGLTAALASVARSTLGQ
ncbi:MAG TPA: ferrochelatase [Candidatus Limnocylindrales bacterium]|nr:ferrochelatase [Candidatus Limnocylindrales bacterium]